MSVSRSAGRSGVQITSTGGGPVDQNREVESGDKAPPHPTHDAPVLPDRAASSNAYARPPDRIDEAPPKNLRSPAMIRAGNDSTKRLALDVAAIQWDDPFVKKTVLYLQHEDPPFDLTQSGKLSSREFATLVAMPWIRDNLPEFTDKVLLGESGVRINPPDMESFSTSLRLLYRLLVTQGSQEGLDAAGRLVAAFGQRVRLDAKVTDAGKALRSGAQWSLKLPGETGPVVVQLYGRPSETNGEWKVHLQRSLAASGAPNPVLETMAWGDFQALTLDRFKNVVGTYFRAPPMLVPVQPPSGQGSKTPVAFRICKVVDAPKDSDVSLVASSGEKLEASYEDLLRWNCHLTPGEQECFRKYLDAGGQGRVVSFEDHPDPEYHGNFLIAETQGNAELWTKVLTTKSIAPWLDEVEQSPAVLIMAGRPQSGVVATTEAPDSALMKLVNLAVPSTAGRPGFVFSERVTPAVVCHELVHVKQDLSGSRAELEALRDKGVLEPKDGPTIDSFLAEQPAYAAHLQFLAANPRTGIPLGGLANAQEFTKRYAQPVSAILDRLAGQPKHYAAVKAVLQKYTVSSGHVSLAKVLPPHF